MTHFAIFGRQFAAMHSDVLSVHKRVCQSQWLWCSYASWGRYLLALIACCREALQARRRPGPVSETIAAGFPHCLVLLAVRVRAVLGLALHAGERRGDGTAFLLVLVLLRLLLFLVALHLAFRHGVLWARWMGWIRLWMLQTNPSAPHCANGMATRPKCRVYMPSERGLGASALVTTRK
jgi:hypothetical protein